MKNKLIKIALFVGIPAILFAASARIKDLATTTTTAAVDDYVALDGTTNGTRKMLASYLFGSGNVTNNATLANGNVVFGGGTTVIAPSNMTWTAGNNTLTTPNIIVSTNGTFGNVTTSGLDLSAATITGNLSIGSGLVTIGSGTGPVAGGLKLFGGTSGNVTIAPTAAAGSGVTMTVPAATDTFVGKATTDTLTNKTFDANATGNVFKAYGYLILTHPTVFGSGVTQQTTVTSPLYGQALFSNSADKATNYVEYILTVPDDVDTSVDMTAKFKFILGGADTGDHEYEISMINVADSAVYDGALGNAVSLTYTADGSGADKDVETAGAPDTLTGWAAAVTAGRYWRIRVARDGDNANDGSTVNSYSGPLIIRYGITQ